MFVVKTVSLFALTAAAELGGCYAVYLWLRESKSAWLLALAAVLLALFAWLLTLHPFPAGRTYAAYGAVYVSMAIGWLWWVEGVTPTRWDIIGGSVTLAGMAIIAFAPRD